MELTVRYAERDELERVNELRSAVNDVHVNGRPDIFRSGFCAELREHIYQKFDAAESDVIVAVADGVICGFETVEYIARPASPYCLARAYYRIEEFGVDASFRRKGVATALIAFARTEAAKKGFSRIELDVWEFNEAARAFYDSVGFETYRRYLELNV